MCVYNIGMCWCTKSYEVNFTSPYCSRNFTLANCCHMTLTWLLVPQHWRGRQMLHSQSDSDCLSLTCAIVYTWWRNMERTTRLVCFVWLTNYMLFIYTFWIFKMQLMLNFKELYLRMIFHNVVFCEVNPSFIFYLEHEQSCTVNYLGVRSSVVSLNELFQRLVNLCSDKLIRRNLVWSVIAGTNILFFERNTFDYWITKVSVLMIDIGQNYVRIES